jgi:hypothetical protein
MRAILYARLPETPLEIFTPYPLPGELGLVGQVRTIREVQSIYD